MTIPTPIAVLFAVAAFFLLSYELIGWLTSWWPTISMYAHEPARWYLRVLIIAASSIWLVYILKDLYGN